MKVENINLELYHYIDKDFECKHSQLIIRKTVNGDTSFIKVDGMDAEAIFSLVNDLTKKEEKDEDTKTDNEG